MIDYTSASTLPAYMPFPLFLLSMPLSDAARLVYARILARICMSQSNGWIDEDSRVYCRYPIKNLAEDCRRSRSTVISALSELEKQGLLCRRREGTWNANKLYLRMPEICTADDRNSGPQYTGIPATNYKINNKKNKYNKNTGSDYQYQGDSL